VFRLKRNFRKGVSKGFDVDLTTVRPQVATLPDVAAKTWVREEKAPHYIAFNTSTLNTKLPFKTSPLPFGTVNETSAGLFIAKLA
jgi:hypothetical protein